jgi:hypothetical protein
MAEFFCLDASNSFREAYMAVRCRVLTDCNDMD